MTKEMKTCTKCKEVKGLECFSKDKNKRDGLQSGCKVCVKDYYQENREARLEYAKIYIQENKEVLAEKNKIYRQENKEAKAEYGRIYYQENKEALLAQRKIYQKSYFQDNKDVYAAQKAKRRAAKLNATPPWFTKEQNNKIKMYYKISKALEKMDGIKRHVDHIVPLQGKNVCGLHVPWNLQVLTAEENLSKNNAHDDWD